MDSLITAAARALAAGDPLGALQRIALREDPHALALRGIAMAQLGDFGKARELVRRAARAFGAGEAVARARCVVAEAEIALASRDLKWPARALDAARLTLERHGDLINAAHARYLAIRKLLLLGKLQEVERALATTPLAGLPPALAAAHQLMVAGIAMRRVQAEQASAALEHAAKAALQAGIPALTAEVEHAIRRLTEPVARHIMKGEERPLLLADVEALFASRAFIVDACRHVVRHARNVVTLARRPVLFALVRALGEAFPGDASREALIAAAFHTRRANESHRARLRVEIARLRVALRPLAGIVATPRGFALQAARADRVVVLAQPVEEAYAWVLALLADGEAWSTSGLALVLGASQRNMQRALADLVAAGKVQALGRGRSRRWITPLLAGAGFATPLLLPAPLPGD